MSVKKIIPCLDVKDGKLVKGIHFEDLRVVGGVVENALYYTKEGADEIVFLDISATIEGRKTLVELVKEVIKNVSVPLIVGGGIKSLENIEELLLAGVNKVSINTGAFKNPLLIREASKKFGRESLIVAIDAKKFQKGKWEVYIESGKRSTGKDVIEWAKEVEGLGAGGLLPTSIDVDGTQQGYDLELTRSLKEAVRVPVIASGGAGKLEHMYEVLTEGKADAILLASILHFRKFTIPQIKNYLKKKGVPVNLST